MRSMQGAAVNVMAKVGVNPGFAMQLSRGMGTLRGNSKRSEQQAEQERVCKRFWAALILTDLIEEVGWVQIARRWALVLRCQVSHCDAKYHLGASSGRKNEM